MSLISEKIKILNSNRNILLLLEDKGVAAFKFKEYIDDIIIKIYNKSLKTNENDFYIDIHLPGLITNLKVNVKCSLPPTGAFNYEKERYSEVNDKGEIAEEEIILYFDFKSDYFDVLSLFRMVYHELNHIIEFYYCRDFITDVTDTILDMDLIQKTFDSVKFSYRMCISEPSIKFTYNVNYMFNVLFSKTESRALIGGLYGELLYMNVYCNIDLNKAIKNTQPYVCLTKTRELLKCVKEIPKDVLQRLSKLYDTGELYNSEESKQTVKFKEYDGLTYANIVDVLGDCCVFFRKYNDELPIYKFVKQIIKIMQWCVDYIEKHMKHTSKLFTDVDKRSQIAANDFIKKIGYKLNDENMVSESIKSL